MSLLLRLASPTLFAGDSTGTAAVAGALTTGIALAGGVSSSAVATGALTTNIVMAGDATGSSSATGALATGTQLAGDAAGSSSATGALATGISFAGAASGTATVTGNLHASGVTLVGADIGIEGLSKKVVDVESSSGLAPRTGADNAARAVLSSEAQLVLQGPNIETEKVMSKIYKGSRVRLSARFTNSSDALVDPTTVELTVTESGQTPVDATADVVNDSVGKYHVDFLTTVSGKLAFRWSSTAVGEESIGDPMTVKVFP